MQLNASSWLNLIGAGSLLVSPAWSAIYNTQEFKDQCSGFAPKLHIANATVYFSQFVAAGTNLSIPDYNVTCGAPFQVVSADLCRVGLYVATSNRSGINMEAWLPSNWSGRFLSTGNGGLGGCIQYNDVAYGAGLGFATVGANNGHNGTSGGAFFNNADILADFAFRSMHTGVVVGKKITESFFGQPHAKSYYLGCSTGGRQGFKAAQDFPEDFDGIVAGAPAVAFNNLTSWSGHFYPITGNATAPTFVPGNMWPVIHGDILKQCDGLDKAMDGILEDPSLCKYDSSGLICKGNQTANCLTRVQSQTVQKIFEPLLAPDGSLIYPRMQPGSEIIASFALYNGQPFPYTTDWFQFAIYNTTSFDPTQIKASDYATAARINPFNIETWKGDLSRVRDRGAKILHYHGLMDPIISSENSPRYYEHVKSTMGLQNKTLDDFYRFFRISGTSHCTGGDGASVIGQTVESVQSTDPSENVLMAMVDWVEKQQAPEFITGTRWVNGTQALGVDYKRRHCKYPTRNVFQGGDVKNPDNWKCT